MPSPAGRTDSPRPDCPVEVALTAISGRWTTLILRDLMHRPRSFGQLRSALPDISDKVLAERLTALHKRGLVHREKRPGFPSQVVYSLTVSGQLLRPLLIELYHTGQGLQRASEPIAERPTG